MKAKPSFTHRGNPRNREFRVEEYPFYLIDQVDHHYGAAMESVLRSLGMERIRWQVLLVLREYNPSSISELASRCNKKLSTVSRAVDRMETDGLVACSPRAGDARVTEVNLREEGRRTLAHVLKAAGSQYERALAGFSDPETRQLQEFLVRLLSNLKRSPYA